ncbi:nitroreductase family protein [Candidatus Woesearchaeota archaeon]|nr:nitroreductase family protein [Candidatus Woesearchaeota archaeon]
MEVLEAIQNRRSVRKYMNVPVEWEKIGRVVDAGRIAPSAGNVQDRRFIVVVDEGVRKKLADAALHQNWMVQAPVHIAICSFVDKIKRMYGIRGERLYSIQNAAASAMQMMLAAESMGLATCWVGAFEENMVQRALGCPDEVRVSVILTLGYADEKPKAPARFTIEHVTNFNGYGGNAKKILDIGTVLWNHNIAGRASKEAKQTVSDVKALSVDERKKLSEKIKSSTKRLTEGFRKKGK